jgi:hypothetical protein
VIVIKDLFVMQKLSNDLRGKPEPKRLHHFQESGHFRIAVSAKRLVERLARNPSATRSCDEFNRIGDIASVTALKRVTQ